MSMKTNRPLRAGKQHLTQSCILPILLLALPLAAAAASDADKIAGIAEAKPVRAFEQDDWLAALRQENWASTDDKKAGPTYSGRFKATYDYRESGDDEDSDVYGYWNLGAKDLVRDRLEFYGSGKLHQDLDDDAQSTDGEADIYLSLDDTDSDLDNKIFQFYLEGYDKGRQFSIKAGRQYVDIADYLHMDGVQFVAKENARLGGRIFGGRAVAYFDDLSSDDYFGGESDDYLAGGSLIGKPWEGNVTRLTYAMYHADDDRLDDEHLFLDSREQVSDELRLRGQASMLNGEFRMVGIDAYYSSLEKVSDFMLGVRRWGEFEAKTRAYSPFFSVLGEQQPYTYVYARSTRELKPWLLLSPGVNYRLPDDTTPGNREYGNYDLTLIYEPNRTWNSSISLEYWDVEEGNSFAGLSGELRYRHDKVFEITAGAAYLHYEYFQESDFSTTINGGETIVTSDGTRIERDPESKAYYLRGKWNLNDHFTLWLRGEVEDSDEVEDLSYRGRGSLAVKF